MSVWSQYMFQESVNSVMELLSLFHDYSLAIISMILVFVGGLSLSMVFNMFISDSLIVTMVEVVWTMIPMVILLFLAVPSLKILYFMDENSPFLTVKAVGHQWYWSYEMDEVDLEFDSYMLSNPEGGEFRLLDTDHRLILPVGKNVRMLVTAADVLHCWALPAMGVKADAVPGRLNQVNFNALRSSVCYGQCSEICGANHSFMPITLESVSVESFLEWCKLY